MSHEYQNGNDKNRKYSIVNQIAPRRFEPHEINSQVTIDKSLTTTQKVDLPSYLLTVMKNNPELNEVIKIWPKLHSDIKSAIITLIQNCNK
jgi:hypothetical protein